jgi:hypothetical protein
MRPLGRPSELDNRVEKESSSFYSSEESLPFGCHLRFGGDEWEVGKMIFSEEDSTMFPGKKELIAFWYDDCYAEYGDHGPVKSVPIFEHV